MKMKTKLKLFLIGCFLILGSSLFGQGEHWPVEHIGNNSTTVYCKITIDNVPQTSTVLEIASFIDNESSGNCHLVDYSSYGYGYVAMLPVRYNASTDMGKNVTFKLYDPNNDKEYVSNDVVQVQSGSIGSLLAPITIDFHEDNSSNEWYWDETIPNYGTTPMMVNAVILIDGVEQNDANTSFLQLAAFSGNELRGKEKPIYEDYYDRHITYLGVSGQGGEEIAFKLYNPLNGIVYDTDFKVNFVSAGIIGDMMSDPIAPQPINFITPYFAAQINETRYASLKDAIAAAVNNDLIKVINNISQTEAVEFPAGMNLTLDLNGYDVEVTTGSITVAGNLTLVDNAGGASFTTTVSNFIINEDAQLYHTLAGIHATAVKSIEQTTDGWDGIASPMTAESILNIETNGINELYYYDETGSEQNGLEWVAMDETSDNSYTLNKAGRGYLYANSVDPNPNQPQVETVVFDFEGGTLDGWTTIDDGNDGTCWEVENGVAKIITAKGKYDYMVTSKQYLLNEDFVLSFDIYANAANTNNSNRETYSITIFETEEDYIEGNYLDIYSEDVTPSNSGSISLGYDDFNTYLEGEWSGLSEKPVCIAFGHEGRKNDNFMTLDNISITSTSADDGNATNGAILNFAGVLNNEDVSYDLTYTDSQLLKGFHLLGNPFAHNINVMNVWNETLANGYYAISNRGEWLARSTDNVAEVIAPMEAFLIKAGQAGKLTIRKNAGAKRSSSNGSLMISVTNGELRDDAYVSFNAGIGLDKISHRNENAPMLYIPAQDKNYAVAVMDKEVKEIPLSFEAKQMGQYTISAEALNCEFEELYLIDKQTGTTTNLNLEDYTFIARTGDDEERFVITKSLSGTNPESHDESFIYIDNGDLVVKNIEGEGHVRVYDVLGRPVAEFMAVESARISTERFGNGIYVIQMSDENGVKVQKILID